MTDLRTRIVAPTWGAAFTRRQFVSDTLTAAAASTSIVRSIVLPRLDGRSIKPARLAVITDLHHGLAPDALARFDAFLAAASQRRYDAMLQMGDFCYSDAGAADCLARWRRVTGTRMSILGNHDMDKCDKPTAVQAFGMRARYYAQDIGGYRFVVLDLNNFRKDGVVVPYAHGNYFTDNATFNCADPEQLRWLDAQLRHSNRPVVILSHQPLGFGEPGQSLPPEQTELFEVIHGAAVANPVGAVVACLSGHLHVDRLEYVGEIPCLLVNSASYFWSSGMYAYSRPLYAFMEFGHDGTLTIEGISGEFVKTPPVASDSVAGRSASIQDRAISTGAGGR